MMSTLSDAWHSLVPAAGDSHGPLTPLLLVLTVVTGLMDAFGYLVLGQVFLANMTGNVLLLGLAVVGAKGFSVAAHATSLVAFSIGALGSGRLAARVGTRRGRLLAASTACEVALVATSLAVGLGVANPGAGSARYVLIVLLSLSGGMQTGTARRLAVPDLITTVLTRNIASAAFDSRLAGGSNSRIGRRGLSVVAMFAGAVVGGLLELHVDKSLSLLAGLVLLAVVALAAGRLSRPRPAWDAMP
jgi:uncharacterized membrane protein YoaK (UPF0700 family)